ncbi:MAG: zinc ribbon domain-containing protein [Nitrososphaeraceae archaeon]
MYNNKLVVAIKANGKILREHKDSVFIPFNSEYSILIKNLHTVRADIKISIDGTDVLNNNSLIVNGNDEIELTRFFSSNNLTSGNRFKFIERTDRVEQHRGIKLDDGLIRVQFQFERKGSPPPVWYGINSVFGNDSMIKRVRSCDSSSYSTTDSASFISSTSLLCSNSVQSNTVQNDIGITVPGSFSDQSFKYVGGFSLESDVHVMVLKLLGETFSGEIISEPITVTTKQKCITCGHINKSKNKFCSECGTSLQII